MRDIVFLFAVMVIMAAIIAKLPKPKKGVCDYCGVRLPDDETRCDDCADFARTAP